jgi:hypothetical protein
MMLLSFSEYLPYTDLIKILIVAVIVALIAPSAVSVAIVGLDDRESGKVGRGNALVALGGAILLVLVLIGLYTLVQK